MCELPPLAVIWTELDRACSEPDLAKIDRLLSEAEVEGILEDLVDFRERFTDQTLLLKACSNFWR